MKEKEITRFLATKVLGWLVMSEWVYYNPAQEGILFLDEPAKTTYLDFDPIHNIVHAFMVVEKFTDSGGDYPQDIEISWNGNKWFVHLNTKQMLWENKGEVFTAKTLPEAISIAAVRARATDEKILEMGL